MKSILFREIQSFFGSIMGYLVVGVFLLLNGLFLWVFEGEYNILNSSFADLTPFFNLAPWVLIFLIPAVTMRSFSEEIKQGTIELLLTKPLTIWQIVCGKFFGAMILIVMALLPTLVYVYVVSDFAAPNTHIDSGSIMGSYFGLLFLIAGYTAVGVFTSVLTENQIVAFIVSIMICFGLYYGLEALAGLFTPYNDTVANLGMDYHFRSISRGVIDTRDIIYFISVSVLFLSLTAFKLKTIKS